MEETNDRHTAVVVTAEGEYDADNLGPLTDRLSTAAETHRTVVLDASAITFADSSFLNLLLKVHHTTALRIAGPRNQLSRLLQMTCADRVLDLRPTVEDALRP
ncbi:STAS domain-containing protein [Streptomyces sp. cmx-4-9]|uniref:STAS domain-containing protein n=1 Tax=Streptomyces sp. cmx-4-9 TaxID=2790941 RepID=UPI003980202C